MKAGNIKRFNKPFRTKKNEKLRGYSYPVEKNNINKDKDKLFLFKTLLGEMRYYGTKQLHKLIQGNKPAMDCRVQKSAYGEYFLVIPYVVKAKTQKKDFSNPVSIDPGVRKFVTTYAPASEESYMIGNRWTRIIMQELLKLDKEKDVKKQKRLRKRVFLLEERDARSDG